jgi:hypothetical protein
MTTEAEGQREPVRLTIEGLSEAVAAGVLRAVQQGVDIEAQLAKGRAPSARFTIIFGGDFGWGDLRALQFGGSAAPGEAMQLREPGSPA